jgi:hypothetical protein
MEKETLEEAADMDSKNHYKDQSDYWAIGFDSFKRGAKWQQKRMYSAENMLESFIQGALTDLFNTWNLSNEDMAKEKFKIWFEKFKNV